MKIPRVRFLITAYHSVVASPVARIWNHGAGGGVPSSRAISASISCRCVAT